MRGLALISLQFMNFVERLHEGLVWKEPALYGKLTPGGCIQISANISEGKFFKNILGIFSEGNLAL